MYVLLVFRVKCKRTGIETDVNLSPAAVFLSFLLSSSFASVP